MNKLRSALIAVTACLLLSALNTTLSGDGNNLFPRMVPPGPEATLVTDVADPALIILKFSEGNRIRLINGVLSSSDSDLALFRETIRLAGNVGLKPLFSRPPELLDAERALGQTATGKELADLNLYYLVTLHGNTDPSRTASLCDALNQLEIVEIAYPVPPAADPDNCTDVNPVTPSWSDQQDYSAPAPVGIDAQAAWDQHPDVNGIKDYWIVDVEQGWNLDHEDLDIDYEDVLNGPYDNEKRDHGTAVLGEIAACDTHDEFGMIGLVPGSQLKMVDWNLEPTVAEAFDIAASHLAPGEIYLIEIQTFVGGRTVPMEYFQAEFDAISAHTARGVVVVEAAGNGSEDLDDPFYEQRFDRLFRDSGAIMVGAGTPTAHSPEWFTNYGSRVDCQGYGSSVYSTGYGDLWSSGIDQYYTDGFSGTSSASPIVTGAAAMTQLMSRSTMGRTLTPIEVRDLLSNHGTPQGEPTSKHIGVLPDLAEIAQNIPETFGWNLKLTTDTPVVSPGEYFSVTGELTNLGASPASAEVWSHVLLTNGLLYPSDGELIGPVTVTFDAGQTGIITINHRVPSSAPSGKYLYRGFVGTHDSEVLSTGYVHVEIP